MTCTVAPLFLFQGFPDCKSWCPASKPVPPSYTGLTIHPSYDNDKEYWEGESIKYVCNDTTLGIDRNDTTEKTFQCLIDEPTGRFAVPKNGSEWPACLKRTTTPHPAILSAFSLVRSRSDHNLIDEETRKAYISERNAGDEDYYLTKLIPALVREFQFHIKYFRLRTRINT